jgi:hypothetical protein
MSLRIAGSGQEDEKIDIRKRCELAAAVTSDSNKGNVCKACAFPELFHAVIDGLAQLLT